MSPDQSLEERRNLRSESWSLYPVFLQKPAEALIIGGGEVGSRKALNLIGCGWFVRLVSSEFHPLIEELINTDSAINLSRQELKVEDLEIETKTKYYLGTSTTLFHLRSKSGGVKIDGNTIKLVFCCTDNKELNSKIREVFQGNGYLVNCVDDPENSDFVNGSVVRENKLTVALSSNGEKPGMIKKLKKSLAAFLQEFSE